MNSSPPRNESHGGRNLPRGARRRREGMRDRAAMTPNPTPAGHTPSEVDIVSLLRSAPRFTLTPWIIIGPLLLTHSGWVPVLPNSKLSIKLFPLRRDFKVLINPRLLFEGARSRFLRPRLFSAKLRSEKSWTCVSMRSARSRKTGRDQHGQRRGSKAAALSQASTSDDPIYRHRVSPPKSPSA